jgi:hypothetical protein
MIQKIPENTEFFVSNGSDFVQNIHNTKNVDFDEEGYIRLSAPFARYLNGTENTELGVPYDIIAIDTADYDDQKYKVVTADSSFDIDLQSYTITADAGAPVNNTDSSRFVGWKNGDWYSNVDGDIYSLQEPLGTVWDIENTDGADYIEVLTNRNTLVGATANSSIQQYTENDMDGTTPPSTNSEDTLQLPRNFDITGMAYSNYRLGIATINRTGGNAYFFVWDGVTTSANQGLPVSAQSILDVVAYQNSWAIVTSAGELLYFNGAGFDLLGKLPVAFTRANWCVFNTNATYTHGRTMQEDAGILYLNIGSFLSSSEDDSGLLKGFYSGVWCYDPKVGLYHRYGISNSKLYKGSVSATSGTFSSTAHKLETGDRVMATQDNKTYFAIKVTADTFKLADTYTDAIANTASSTFGTGSDTLWWILREDWMQIENNNNVGLFHKFSNGQLLQSTPVLPVFLGGNVCETDMTSTNVLSIMAPRFDNIGHVAYAKQKSQGIKDTWQAVVVKHKPLTESDKIIVKVKYQDFYKPLAIGEASDFSGDIYVTWTDSDTFTTTKDLTGVLVGHEVEFMQGAGAGQTAHISSFSENAGTWTVNLDESIRGASSGTKSTCIFDSYTKVFTIDANTQDVGGFSYVRLEEASKWLQVKLEMRGVDIAIEETRIISETHQPSA